MPASPFTTNAFMQFCWVVPDLEAAMAEWTKRTGVGPFFKFDQVAFENPRWHGRPAESPSHVAGMAQSGDVQIELVELTDDKPSYWTEVVPRGKVGLHHGAIYSQDYDADLAAYQATGVEIAFEGLMLGNRVCWLDTTAMLGFMVELLTFNPVSEFVFGQIRDAAQDWDGKDPIRRISPPK